MAISFTVFEEWYLGGWRYYAIANGNTMTKFYVGTRYTYEGTYVGLNNSWADSVSSPSVVYSPEQYSGTYPYWNYFIYPMAICESNARMITLNTYDRARFTWGFLQFAAHVPNGDFVGYFRRLLALSSAKDYFPGLVLSSGRIYTTSGVDLESPDPQRPSEIKLAAYLNPSTTALEDVEIYNAARFIHWHTWHTEPNALQVEFGMQFLKAKMREYAVQYSLDGKPDVVCLVVLDIRHQGRGKDYEIRQALSSSDPYRALLAIGGSKYASRVQTLDREISRQRTYGRLGNRWYSVRAGDFVSTSSAAAMAEAGELR